MKTLFYSLLVAVMACGIVACGGKETSKEASNETNTTSNTQTQNPTIQNPTIQNPSVQNPAGNAIPAGTKHYICSNDCEGSGGDVAGNCPVCGNPYAHNAAFHGNVTNSSIEVPPDVTINSSDYNKPPPGEPGATPPTADHFVCTKAGCAGGGTAAGNCSVCGSALVYNAQFHQQ